MCDNGECGMCFGWEIPAVSAGQAALASAAVTTAGGVYNAQQTNASNQAIAGQNTAANAYMQVQNQTYNAEEAAKAREWNANQAALAVQQGRENQQWAMDYNRDEAQKARDFNATEAQKNRDYQTEMSNTQYQRTIGDMKAAGINPMLATKNGGAGNVSGSAASGPAASQGAQGAQMSSGPSASSGGWGGPGQWTAQGPLPGGTISSAIAAAETAKKLEMYDAQIRNTDASTDQIMGKTPKSVAEIRELNTRADKTQEEIQSVLAQTKNLQQDTRVKEATERLQNANEALTKAQTKVASGQLSIQEATKAQINADTALSAARKALTDADTRIKELPAKAADQATGAIQKGIGNLNIFEKAYDYGRDLGNKLKHAW